MKRVLLAISICFAVTIAAAGYYLARIAFSGFSARTPPGPVETASAQWIRKMAVPARYKEMKNPVRPTAEAMREGREHWADHCASCHANNGSGDTMYGKGMYPRPPDMRQKHTQEMSDGELYFTIQNGIRLSGMPAFGGQGDDDLDSWKLVVFMRHLPALSTSEQVEMTTMNPKSAQEFEEEQEEESFLHEGSTSRQPLTHRKEPE